MRSKFKMGSVLVALTVSMFLLASCTPPETPEPTATPDPTSVTSCGELETEITAATTERDERAVVLIDAEAKAEAEKDDAADEALADAQAEANEAEANLASLTAQAEECKTVGNSTNLVQCRVNAVIGYMQAQGFKDGDYVIGEENIDLEAPALTESGALAFGKDGANVLNREDLKAVFDSEEPRLQAVVKAQKDKFPSLAPEVILNPERWEIVQLRVASFNEGNTGYSSDQLVWMGTRENQAGDASWLYIDTSTCTVPLAEVQPPGVAEGSEDPAVGLIRAGCINPGNSLKPNYPPAPPTTTTPPVDVCVDCAGGSDAKSGTNDVGSPGNAWTPLPVEGSPSAPAPAPAIPFVPATPPHTDTGTSVPVTGATPAPAPDPSDPPVVSDPGPGGVTTDPEAPGTNIPEP